MNYFETLTKDFKKMDKWMKYLLIAFVLLLLFALFWPTDKSSPQIKLVPVSGTSYYKAVFEGFSSDDKVKASLANNKPTLAAFVAPWCGYCKQLKPTWQSFEDDYADPNCNVLSVDCTQYKELGKKHGVGGYPTIKYLPNGLNDPSGSEDYSGPRTAEGFKEFLATKKM